MSDDEHKRIVRRYYDEVFAQRNLAALDELFAPNFVGHSAAYRGANPPSRSEEGGTYTLADMRRDTAWEHEAMPEDQTIVEEQIAEGDRVVTRWRYRWKHDQSLFGEAPTGQWLTMAGVQIDRLASGKIVERWEVKDFWGVVTHLGGKVVFSDSLPSAQSESQPPAITSSDLRGILSNGESAPSDEDVARILDEERMKKHGE